MPSRPVWIDAVCINQHDLDERSSQVSLMGTIFATASSVVIWLGDPDQRALEATGNLRTEFRRRPKDEWDQMNPDYAIHLSRFFSFPWFGRVWVVQERWLARKATVHCGKDTVSWDSILMASEWMRGGGGPGTALRTLPSLWTTIEDGQDRIPPLSPILSAEMPAQDKPVKNKRRVKMLTLVLGSLELRASDSRDKIFAMLGLGEETSTQDGIPLLLRPNYKKPVSQVYADFTRWWIQTYKKLSVLSAVHAARDRAWQDMEIHQWEAPESASSRYQHRQSCFETDVPSWTVPDGGNSFWAAQALGLQPNLFHATGETVVNLHTCRSENHNGRFLVLEGERVGKIAEIGPFEIRRTEVLRWTATTRLFEKLTDQELDDTGTSRRDMTAATFIHLFDPTGSLGVWNHGSTIQANAARFPSKDMPRAFEAHLVDHGYSKTGYSRGGSCCRRLNEITTFPCISDCYFKLEVPRPNVPIANAAADCRRVNSARAKDSIKDELEGHQGIPQDDSGDDRGSCSPFPPLTLEGLCPAGARPGDIVVLLYGGDVPFIPRELPSHDTAGPVSPEQDCCLPPGRRAYSLVGECYLEGHMSGKFFEAGQGTVPEWFTLV
ncbi:hypothetical protein RB597_000953 [Gaeumannomyces tritici]